MTDRHWFIRGATSNNQQGGDQEAVTIATESEELWTWSWCGIRRPETGCPHQNCSDPDVVWTLLLKPHHHPRTQRLSPDWPTLSTIVSLSILRAELAPPRLTNRKEPKSSENWHQPLDASRGRNLIFIANLACKGNWGVLYFNFLYSAGEADAQKEAGY